MVVFLNSNQALGGGRWGMGKPLTQILTLKVNNDNEKKKFFQGYSYEYNIMYDIWDAFKSISSSFL